MGSGSVSGFENNLSVKNLLFMSPELTGSARTPWALPPTKETISFLSASLFPFKFSAIFFSFLSTYKQIQRNKFALTQLLFSFLFFFSCLVSSLDRFGRSKHISFFPSL